MLCAPVYPELVVGKKRSSPAVALVEEEAPPDWDEADSTIAEMELFLAEHQAESTQEPDEIFEEQDVAEALAVSWKERRKEMVNLRRARKFTQAGESKRSFKVEIEEMKRRTAVRSGIGLENAQSPRDPAKVPKAMLPPTKALKWELPWSRTSLPWSFPPLTVLGCL